PRARSWHHAPPRRLAPDVPDGRRPADPIRAEPRCSARARSFPWSRWSGVTWTGRGGCEGPGRSDRAPRPGPPSVIGEKIARRTVMPHSVDGEGGVSDASPAGHGHPAAEAPERVVGVYTRP